MRRSTCVSGFWDNIVVSFTGSPSVFTGNPSVFTGNPSAREEICVYQFGPEWSNSNSRRLTPDAANSRKVKIPLADLLTPHPTDWHPTVISSLSHHWAIHSSTKTLNSHMGASLLTKNAIWCKFDVKLKNLLFLFLWEELLGWALFCSPAAAPAMADA